MKSIRIAAAIAVAVMSSAAWSQITVPANNSKWAAGPDYATDVLADPWDMSNPEDISRDSDDRSGWASFGFPGDGTVGGAAASPTNLAILERGYYNIIHTNRDGTRYPIDSSVYKKITFKMSLGGAAGQSPAVYWFQSTKGDPAANEGLCTTAGATTARCGVMFVDNPSTGGYQIFTADTTLAANVYGTPFSTFPVLGLRIDPIVAAGINTNVFIDWVRITRADSDPLAAKMPITFGGGNATAITVTDAGGAVYNVMAKSCPTGASPCNFNYGVLAPGQYTLNVNNPAGSTRAVFVINAPAVAQVTDPSLAQPSGADFATTVLGNAWDMNESTDVAALNNVTGVSFSNGILTATNTNSDPNVIMFNSNAVAIDSSKYRYLTYRMKIDGSQDVGNGSIARVFWSPAANPASTQQTTSKDILAYAGTVPGVNDFVDYTIDLGSLTTAINGGIEPVDAQQTWLSANPVHFFRIDPHEFASPRTFHFDYVRLAAMAEAQAGSTFTLKYAATDGDSATSTVALYYAASQSGPKTLIANNLPLSPSGQYAWTINGVPAGTYWIYVETTDTSPTNNGPDVRGQWSTGQIKIDGPGVPGAPTIGSATTTGPGAASVSFTPPTNNGGANITSYTATCTPVSGGPAVTGTAAGSPIPVTGLTNGAAYTCTVHATNSAGNGPESGPSNAVTTSASNTLNVTLAGSGTGTVTGTGINCPGDCTETYGAATPVTLTATATGGSVFTGWLGGGCTGNATTCTVQVAGVQPVTATFAAPGTTVSLDIDNSAPSTKYGALTDGLLVLRYLFGLTGTALTSNAVDAAAKRATAPAIQAYLGDIKPALDVDGNSSADALTDGLMILRKLFGLTGSQISNGAIGPGATRNSSQIEAYISTLMP